MLRDVSGETLTMKSSKIVAVKDFLDDLRKLQKTGKFEEVRELAGGYVSRNVLPTRNVYMARVRESRWITVQKSAIISPVVFVV